MGKNVDSKPVSSSKVKKYDISYSQRLKKKSTGHLAYVIYFTIITYGVSFADIILQRMYFIYILISML